MYVGGQGEKMRDGHVGRLHCRAKKMTGEWVWRGGGGGGVVTKMGLDGPRERGERERWGSGRVIAKTTGV